MWRHQFMLASFGLLLVLSGVVSAVSPDDARVVPQAKNDLPRGRRRIRFFRAGLISHLARSWETHGLPVEADARLVASNSAR